MWMAIALLGVLGGILSLTTEKINLITKIFHIIKYIYYIMSYCIIGGGPVGLSLVYVLANNNYDVVLIERDSKLGGSWKMNGLMDYILVKIHHEY